MHSKNITFLGLPTRDSSSDSDRDKFPFYQKRKVDQIFTGGIPRTQGSDGLPLMMEKERLDEEIGMQSL